MHHASAVTVAGRLLAERFLNSSHASIRFSSAQHQLTPSPADWQTRTKRTAGYNCRSAGQGRRHARQWRHHHGRHDAGHGRRQACACHVRQTSGGGRRSPRQQLPDRGIHPLPPAAGLSPARTATPSPPATGHRRCHPPGSRGSRVSRDADQGRLGPRGDHHGRCSNCHGAARTAAATATDAARSAKDDRATAPTRRRGVGDSGPTRCPPLLRVCCTRHAPLSPGNEGLANHDYTPTPAVAPAAATHTRLHALGPLPRPTATGKDSEPDPPGPAQLQQSRRHLRQRQGEASAARLATPSGSGPAGSQQALTTRTYQVNRQAAKGQRPAAFESSLAASRTTTARAGRPGFQSAAQDPKSLKWCP
jgi:hypothetical protein